MEGDEKFDNQFASQTERDFIGLDGDLSSTNEVIHIDKRSKREKALTVLIVGVMFAAVFFGYYQLVGSIRGPLFTITKNNTKPDEKNCLGGDCVLEEQLRAILAAKQKDTDQDGLSDYDEFNTYNTSPYLADSDSDGFSDKKEIDAGYDPNCPGQEACFRVETGATSEGQAAPVFQTQLSQPALGLLTPAAIREFLIKSGASAEQVAQLSDEDIMILYQEAAASNNLTAGETQLTGGMSISPATTIGQTPAADLSGVSINSFDDLKNLTGAQIRALLISQGAPETVLSQVTDDQLKEMFLSKLNEKTTQ